MVNVKEITIMNTQKKLSQGIDPKLEPQRGRGQGGFPKYTLYFYYRMNAEHNKVFLQFTDISILVVSQIQSSACKHTTDSGYHNPTWDTRVGPS